MSTAQTLSNFQQLAKQTTQFMPCSWQLNIPQYLGFFFFPVHPHVPSVQHAKVCWRGELMVKGKVTARSSIVLLC